MPDAYSSSGGWPFSLKVWKLMNPYYKIDNTQHYVYVYPTSSSTHASQLVYKTNHNIAWKYFSSTTAYLLPKQKNY